MSVMHFLTEFGTFLVLYAVVVVTVTAMVIGANLLASVYRKR